ncbi:MAG: EamA family transporter [Hespellia sp.]|nr:EamA family transporter [Hespellia sp.]
MWILFAFGSAVFAGLTAILAKCGIKNTDSNVATALRTIVVLIFSWIMVFLVGSQRSVSDISSKTWLFLILSGLSTGASWLCYFKALQIGDVNKVTPIDKSSTLLTMILAFIFLHERITLIKGFAMVLIAMGTYLMIEKKYAENHEKKVTSENENQHSSNNENQYISNLDIQQEEMDENIRRGNSQSKNNSAWILFAFGSAVFASLTSILGKVGIEGVDSNLGTAIRTVVVLIMAWIVVFVTKKQSTIKNINQKSWLFLVLSGFAIGGSWLCYYRALQTGPASVVVPIDKLSIVVTILFSYIVFGERLNRRTFSGLILIVSGTLCLLL